MVGVTRGDDRFPSGQMINHESHLRLGILLCEQISKTLCFLASMHACQSLCSSKFLDLEVVFAQRE